MDYKKFIFDCFELAKRMGVVKTQYEFAELIGVHRTTLPLINTGRISGKTTAKKVQDWLNTIEIKNDLNEKPTIADEWMDYRKEVAKEILCALIHRGSFNPVEESVRVADELIKKLRESC